MNSAGETRRTDKNSRNFSSVGAAAADVKSRATKTIKKTKNVKFNIKRLVVSAAVLAFCVYFVCMMIGQQSTINRKNSEIRNLNEQITSANQETDRLKEELENVNDPEYLERMAREKLGLVGPNERVYIDANSTD